MFRKRVIPVIYVYWWVIFASFVQERGNFHVQERVVLFRKKVQKEKSQLGILENDSSSSPASTLITVHRSRIVEDGYRQLANISGNGLKGIIRWVLAIG